MKLNIQLFALMPYPLKADIIKQAVKNKWYKDVPDTAIYTIKEDLEFIKELKPPVYYNNKVVLTKIQKLIIIIKLKIIIIKRKNGIRRKND